MNEENILITWQENQKLAARHNHEEITNEIKTKNMNKIKNTFERIKSKTQQLTVIMLVLLVGTSTITDFSQPFEIVYLGLLLIGLISYTIISSQILFKDYNHLNLVESLKAKINMIQNYTKNYDVFSAFFYIGIIILILVQVLTVLPIEFDLKIEASIFLLITWIYFIVKRKPHNGDKYNMNVELNELKDILLNLKNPN